MEGQSIAYSIDQAVFLDVSLLKGGFWSISGRFDTTVARNDTALHQNLSPTTYHTTALRAGWRRSLLHRAVIVCNSRAALDKERAYLQTILGSHGAFNYTAR